jgi:chorismate mutase/prephenate dehydrogenase
MTLDQLRARIAAIDRQIIDLVAERQSLSREIGAVKRVEGRATRDFGREKQVIDAARARAVESGVSPGVAADLMGLLIRSSLTTQEQARVRAEGTGQGQRALVIGGRGKMGLWFAEFLDSQGYDVTVADPAGPAPGFKHAADWQDLPNDFAVTVVATPLGITAGILDALAARGHRGLRHRLAEGPAGAGAAPPGRARLPGRLGPPDVRAGHPAALRPTRAVHGRRRARRRA